MFRLSISSFKRLLSGAGILAVALLLALELLVVRSGWIWSATPQSETGAFSTLEEHVIARSRKPTLVFFGSSRMRDAVMPGHVARAAGLKTDAVLNLGLTGGNPLDALRFYQRNRERLGRSCIFVVGFEDWFLDGHAAPTHRDRQFATLKERWHNFPSSFRTELVTGWLFRTYDARSLIRTFLWSRTLSIFTGDDPSKVWLTEDGRIRWSSIEWERGPETVPDVAETADGMVQGYTRDAFMVRAARKFIALAHDDGVQVVVVRLPLRQSYLDHIARNHGEFLKLYESVFGGLENTVRLPEYRPARWGLAPTDFYDYGHLALRGARKYSTRIGNLLRTEFSETLNANRCGGAAR
jgi:hypothetical protein